MLEEIPEGFQYMQNCPKCNIPFRVKDNGTGRIIHTFNDDGTVSEVESYILDRDDRLEIYCEECGFVHAYNVRIRFNWQTEKHELVGGHLYNAED